MTHPDYEPDVEFWRPEDRAAEKLQDDVDFEPANDWSWLDDPETADLPTDKERK